MKIIFRESGGYAGLVKGNEIDTSQMDHDEEQDVRRLVSESGIVGNKVVVSPENRDVKQYEICIETEFGTERQTIDISNMTDAMKPLIQFLKQGSTPLN